MIKAIIFDCFGVLASPAASVLANKYPHIKTQIDDIIHQADYGLVPTREQFNQLSKDQLGITEEEADVYYWNVSVRDEAVVNWAKGLKSLKKYKIGLISDVGPEYFEKLFNPTEQHEIFDTIVLSKDVGIAKPEKAIFELAAKKLGVKPSECVMIDDMLINIDGAMNAGMQGIRYISLGQARDELNRLLEADRA